MIVINTLSIKSPARRVREAFRSLVRGESCPLSFNASLASDDYVFDNLRVWGTESDASDVVESSPGRYSFRTIGGYPRLWLYRMAIMFPEITFTSRFTVSNDPTIRCVTLIKDGSVRRGPSMERLGVAQSVCDVLTVEATEMSTFLAFRKACRIRLVKDFYDALSRRDFAKAIKFIQKGREMDPFEMAMANAYTSPFLDRCGG